MENLVPPVQVNDLKTLWSHVQNIKRTMGFTDSQFVMGAGAMRATCPDADIEAVSSRLAMLRTLEANFITPLLRYREGDGKLKDTVFETAATIPMSRRRAGTVHKGLPFDVEEFFSRLK
jgi:hypothetical protein